MAAITLRNLTFTYPGADTPALFDINLTINPGEFVTLAGASGCGKTTLLRHMKQALVPHGARSGTVEIDGVSVLDMDARRAAALVGFVAQDADSQLVTDKVWHELAFGLESLGMPGGEIRRRTAEVAAYFSIADLLPRDVRTLSGGQKQTVNLAAAMAMSPEILLLDEPTAGLDPAAATRFIDALTRLNREQGVTVIISEHRLDEVLAVSDRLIMLVRGGVFADGTPAEVGEILRGTHSAMFRAMPAPMRVYAAAPKFGECPVTVREGRAWLTHYREERGLSSAPDEAIPQHGGNAALTVKDAWFRYTREGEDVLRGLSFAAYPGEIFAILGGNGAGKSTALSLALGARKPYRGSVTMNGRIALLPQNPELLFIGKTVEEDLREVANAEDYDAVVRRCRLASLLSRHPYDLSGGERQRAAIAKLLLTRPDILLLDEPTSGLDAPYKDEMARILRGLAADGACVVLVTHDMEFAARNASRVAMLSQGELTGEGSPREFFGGNSFYTTPAARMARGIVPGAVTAEDIIAACGGEVPQYELPPDKPKTAVKSIPQTETPARPAKRKLSARRKIMLTIIAFLIPLTLYISALTNTRSYAAASLTIIFLSLALFFLSYEGRKPAARELVTVAVLCALGVAGRAAFYMLPSVKPVFAVVIVAGAVLGGETGFLVGAMTMFASNAVFGQGPWTPWQMLAMGLIGALAGAVFRGRVRRLPACIFGAAAVILIYGGIMNPASVIIAQSAPTAAMFVAAYIAGLIPDAVSAGATAMFLWMFGEVLAEKIGRVRRM